MIINIPTDIEKKIDHIYISLLFNKLSSENALKNAHPTLAEIKTHGKALKIRIDPGDSEIDFRQRTEKSGNFWNFNFSCDVFDNNKPNFDKLNQFSNKKIVLFIGTSTHIYQIGTLDQPLSFSFRELTEKLTLNISGDCYFPASRIKTTSFRTTF